MTRFREDDGCHHCGLIHPHPRGLHCPAAAAAEQHDAERAAQLETALSARLAAVFPEALPAPDPPTPDAEAARSLATRARQAVAEAGPEVSTAVEAALEEVDGPDGESARLWLEVVAALPWRAPDPQDLGLDLDRAARRLAAAHGGHPTLHAILMDRLGALAYAAEHGQSPRLRPLLLVGPPGTGKSTLAEAFCRAADRPPTVVSVAIAASDSLYLQGCARSWRGAAPGVIIRAARAAGTQAIGLVLDEVDKVSAHGGGMDAATPTATLLELLDGRGHFTDRYVGAALPLRGALLVLTANALEPIPEPLLDRCDVVPVPALSWAERLAVTRATLWPRALAAYGLTDDQVRLPEDGLIALVVAHAAREEAGLRGVESRLAACLQRAITWARADGWPVSLSPAFVAERLGPAGSAHGRPIGFHPDPAASAAPRADEAPGSARAVPRSRRPSGPVPHPQAPPATERDREGQR